MRYPVPRLAGVPSQDVQGDSRAFPSHGCSGDIIGEFIVEPARDRSMVPPPDEDKRKIKKTEEIVIITTMIIIRGFR